MATDVYYVARQTEQKAKAYTDEKFKELEERIAQLERLKND
jgi:hypothetical protein